MRRAIRKLFAISVLQIVAGVGTGVITARVLGVVGRGELAAVLAPLSLAPYVLSLGMTTSATRSAAQGHRLDRIMGTLGGASLLVGAVAILIGLWLAQVLAHGRHEVRLLLEVGVFALPLTLYGGILTAVAQGIQEWTLVSRQRLIVILGPLIADAAFLTTGTLNVATAAAATIGASLLSILPLWPVIRRMWPPVVERTLAREGLKYAVKIAPIGLSQVLNLSLDQAIMAPIVSSRQLGLYSVAVTAAGLSGLLASVISTVMFPNLVLETDPAVGARYVRLGLIASFLLALALAAVSPIALPVLYGGAFNQAYPLVLVLLAAALPLAGAQMLAQVFAAGNRYGMAGLSEVVSLFLTIGGLLLLLRPLGAMGAAVTSFVAYSTNFLWLLGVAPRTIGGKASDYCVPRRKDIQEMYNYVTRAWLALRAEKSADLPA